MPNDPADRTESGLVEPHQVEDVGGTLARCSGRQPTELAEGRHHIGGGLVEGEAIVLGHVPQAGSHTDRVAGHVDAAHLDVPFGGMRETEQDAEQRRLARTVGADEADATGGQLERDVIERGHTRVALGQPVEAQQRAIAHASESARCAVVVSTVRQASRVVPAR